MNNPKILKLRGCGPERLREIFTSTGPDKTGAKATGNSPGEALTSAGTKLVPNLTDTEAPREEGGPKDCCPDNWDIRRRFEDRIRARLLSGIATGIRAAKPYQAVDMAWDSRPIQKEMVPLLLWAEGKIQHEAAVKYLSTQCSAETAAKFLRKGDDGKVTVNLPRICDVSINLVRSFVTRRHAALAALWDNLWPLLKYDPKGTDEEAMLLADATTQRIEVMADEYGYRHFLSQCDRDKLLYGHSLIFPRNAWDKKTGLRMERTNTGETGEKVESYVKAEGVNPVAPHPSRWFWDVSAPLAQVNTDNGPSYLGYWDIVRFGTISDGAYFNTDAVTASEGWVQLVAQENWYFAQYFDPCVLAWPDVRSASNPALGNDRSANVGWYCSEDRDKGVLLTQYFERVNPKVEGIGDYDAEVWLRLTAAGDGTVVAAEFLPSLPACYGAINGNDNRLDNASLAMDMLPYQDMASNIVSTMLEQVRRGFTQLWILNTDVLDPKIVEELKKNVRNQEWWLDPQVLTMSITERQELLQAGGGFRMDMVISQITAKMDGAIQQALQALGQLLALADRLVNSSPNELGQPNPREVSARETQEISTTVQSVYAFYNEGPREQRAAFKRLLFESLMAHGSPSFEVPVLGRYRKETVEAAGFELANKATGAPNTLLKSGVRIKGALRDLDYEYVYTSRDGAERPLNTQGAQVLQQLFVGLIGIPGVAEALGKRRIYTILNIIARMAGAPDEFQLSLDDGEDEALPNPEAAGAMEENRGQIAEVMKMMQQFAVESAALKQVVAEIGRRVGFVGAEQVPAGTVPATNSGPPAPGTPTQAGPAPQAQPTGAPSRAALLQNPR